MAKGDWWIKFEIHTWLNDPKVRRLSRANRDSWLTALCMMRLDGSDRISGTQPQLSHLLGLTLTEFYDFFHDLEASNAADVTHGHASVTDCPEIFTIISRRFRKELKTKEKNRLRKQKQREDEDVTPMSQDRVISNKKEVRSKKEEETRKAASPPRGTRLPEPFFLTEEMREYARLKRPSLDADEETEKFINYWRAKTGRDATKLDWVATWQNWILNSKSNGTNRSAYKKRTDADVLAESAEFYDNYPS